MSTSMSKPGQHPESELTRVDGLILLQRAHKYLLGFYGGTPDDNDREAASKILMPLERKLLDELGLPEQGAPIKRGLSPLPSKK